MLPFLALRLAPTPFRPQFKSWRNILDFSSAAQVFNRRPSSSSRWKDRQSKDLFSREAKVQKLKSRAAFKLLEIDSKYKIFKKSQTVVDLGYAPGSWSQVAVERTKPHGRVLGIDIIPAQPPKGASAIQGDFLSAGVQAEAITFLSKPDRGRVKSELIFNDPESDIKTSPPSSESHENSFWLGEEASINENIVQSNKYRVVDVVLSDMSAPWDQTSGFWKKTLSDPYLRMKNTSGINLKDHIGSMVRSPFSQADLNPFTIIKELCNAALEFALSCLRIGGHFVCKFYQGDEDKDLERKLRQSFGRVNREKPEASRKESKEAYFVALRMKSM